MFARIAILFTIVLATQMLSACSRVVSVEPLLAGMPNSAEHWDGAYLGTIDDEKRGAFPMLLQLAPRADGAYEFTIHAHGFSKDIFAGSGPLDLIGRGEVRIADLGDGNAVAQTRCEIAEPADPNMTAEFHTLAGMMDAAKRFGTLSKTVPQSKYLGPFVYALLRGGAAHPQSVLGLASPTDAKDAAQGTFIDVTKWEGGVGDGLLLGSGLVFEGDDVHISSRSPGAAGPFFARLARKLFAASDVKNSITWTRVPSDKLRTLRLADRFPAPDQVAGWCNLYTAVPKDK